MCMKPKIPKPPVVPPAPTEIDATNATRLSDKRRNLSASGFRDTLVGGAKKTANSAKTLLGQ